MVAHLLKVGLYDEIRAVDLVPPTFTDARVINTAADITNEAAVEEIVRSAGVVFHIASLIELRDNVYRRTRLYDVNVRGVAILLNACIRAGVSGFVYLGSASAFTDGSPRRAPHNEAAFADVTPAKLKTHYAKTKLLAEGLVLRANGRGQLHTVVLRPFSVYGLGDHLQSVDALVGKQIVVLEDGKQLVSMVYVKNMAHWLVLAATALETKPAEVAGQALFVTNSLEEQETSVAQYRAALLRRRRLPPPAVIDIGKFPFAAMALLYTLTEAVDWFTAGRIAGEAMQLNWNVQFFCTVDGTVDATLATRLLGYTPLYSMEASFDDMAAEAR